MNASQQVLMKDRGDRPEGRAETAKDRACKQLGYGSYGDFVQKVKSARSLPDFIEHFGRVSFKQSTGTDRSACCPFHDDKSASFSANVKAGWQCHSVNCGERGGDVIDFIQRLNGVDFDEALMAAADAVGLASPDFSQFKTGPRAKRPVAAIRSAGKVIPQSKVEEIDPRTPPAWPFAMPPKDLNAPVDGESVRFWVNGKRSGWIKKSFAKIYPYRSVKGDLIQLIGRTEWNEDGKKRKVFWPLTWRECPSDVEGVAPSDRAGWVNLGVSSDVLRPVYRAEKLGVISAEYAAGLRHGQLTIIYVEGEKTCDAGALILETETANHLVLSAQGGSNAGNRADWASLKDALTEVSTHSGMPVRIILWPDADEPTAKVADPVGVALSNMTTGIASTEGLRDIVEILHVMPPHGKNDGWDLADAKDEGWSREDVERHLDQANPVGRTEDSAPREGSEDVVALDLTAFGVGIEGRMGGADEETTSVEPIVPIIDGGGETDDPLPIEAQDLNPIRALGYDRGVYYFTAARGQQIVALRAREFKRENLLSIAPLDHYRENFPDRNGGVNWDAVVDHLIETCTAQGIWEPKRERRTGIWGDRAKTGGLNRVVFNMGDHVILMDNEDGEAIPMDPYDVPDSRYVYTADGSVDAPDLYNALAADDPEIEDLRRLLAALPWRHGMETYSSMMLAGWIACAAICGILRWRPHMWLDGPYGSGKSWIMEHIVSKLLGNHALYFKGNSSESGIRNKLHARATPVLFDEAEAESASDRMRMQGVLGLVRHITGGTKAQVVQGQAGGMGEKEYRPTAMFMFSSIGVSLAQNADKSRFARVHLGTPLNSQEFLVNLEQPSEDLLTEEFTARFIGRMIRRSFSFARTERHMKAALSSAHFNFSGRSSDVYGSLLAGAYLLYNEGSLDTRDDAIEWIEGIGEDFVRSLKRSQSISTSSQDHEEIISYLMSGATAVETGNGRFHETVGNMVSALLAGDDRNMQITLDTAERKLRSMGIKVYAPGSADYEALAEDALERASGGGLLFARNHPEIKRMLEKTAWQLSYDNVLMHANGAVEVGRRRFEASMRFHGIFVPFSALTGVLDIEENE